MLFLRWVYIILGTLCRDPLLGYILLCLGHTIILIYNETLTSEKRRLLFQTLMCSVKRSSVVRRKGNE